jgi:hypothetical protein
MKELHTTYARPVYVSVRVRVFKHPRACRDLPPLDLRTPSGRRRLPY